MLQTLFQQLFYMNTFFDCRVCRALDAGRASLLAMLPVLRITYQSCSPRSAKALAPFKICAHFW